MEHKTKEKSKLDDISDASLETKLELEILFMAFESSGDTIVETIRRALRKLQNYISC